MTDKSDSAYRTIGEVASLLAVKPHVLRFWESRFSQLRPVKPANGRRYYRPEDIDTLKLIKTLLYEEGYTIDGARKLMRSKKFKRASGNLEALEAEDELDSNREKEVRQALNALRERLLKARTQLSRTRT